MLLNFFPIYELVGTICGSISKINSDCVTAPTSEESPGSIHRQSAPSVGPKFNAVWSVRLSFIGEVQSLLIPSRM